MFKIFNALSASDNTDFFDLIKKKMDAWEENQLENNVNMLIDACTKNATTSLARDLLRKTCHLAIMKMTVHPKLWL